MQTVRWAATATSGASLASEGRYIRREVVDLVPGQMQIGHTGVVSRNARKDRGVVDFMRATAAKVGIPLLDPCSELEPTT